MSNKRIRLSTEMIVDATFNFLSCDFESFSSLIILRMESMLYDSINELLAIFKAYSFPLKFIFSKSSSNSVLCFTIPLLPMTVTAFLSTKIIEPSLAIEGA